MTRLRGSGLWLNVERFGDGDQPPLVLLHGFTGSAATWEPLAASLGRERTLIAIDLPGHGASDCPADPGPYRVERTVEEILAVCDRLGLERLGLLGYSLGGRVALHLALAAPDRIDALILESTSPGIADPAERAARRRSDEGLACLLEDEGIEAFVDRWEQAPLFASQARLPAEVRARHRAQRLGNDPRGLAMSLRGIGAGVPLPIDDHLAEIALPALVMAGALDAKYVTIGELLVTVMPSARLAVVPDVGHAVHLEAPETFADLVREHLGGCLPGAPARRGGADHLISHT